MKAKEFYPNLLFNQEYPMYDEDGKKVHFDLVIFDEKHKIVYKDYNSIQFKYLVVEI